MLPNLFRNLLLATTLALPIVPLNIQNALANHLDFTLYNNNELSIWAIYVSAAKSDYWGGDILGRDVLSSGESTRVSFPYSTASSPCVYDIKIVYSNATYDLTQENLCQIDSISTRGYGGDYILQR